MIDAYSDHRLKDMSITAITEAIATVAEAEHKFKLSRTEASNFFREWRTDLPSLTETERIYLDQLRQRYLYQRNESHLSEATVMLLFVSPLLMGASFFDPPFKVRSEEAIKLTLNDEEGTLTGRLDVLVIQNNLWIIVVEAKKTALSIWTALPQTLAYLMSNPDSQQPNFAMITNGYETVFIKVLQGSSSQYNVSRVFATLVSAQEIYTIVQILKGISSKA